MYIAYDEYNQTFYATPEVDKAVVMDGNILTFDTVNEAIDIADSFSKSLNANPPMGVTVHFCNKRSRYVISMNGERRCSSCG